MYLDSHTHLDFFKEQIGEALKRIEQHQIITLANSMDIETYALAKAYSQQSKYIIPSFGIHPWKAADYKGDLQALIPYIEESELIGEIGLDYVWAEAASFEAQRKIFYFLLEQACLRKKVISLHTKGAEKEVLEALKKYKASKVIIHWYSGDLEVLEELIDLGCYFTISVDLGYSELTTEILKKIPLDQLLVETDGPTSLEWVNGQYGYPEAIKEVVRQVAHYKNMEVEALKKRLIHNFETLMGHPLEQRC